MKSLTSADIRQMFLDFFKEKGHTVEPSASLVPHEDPTLLWINSGVATLKKYFDGRVIPENPRIVNAQKSIRTNDIENVGFTARHHTFFEMLGNFSIGDYFKEEAMEWAWEFLTEDQWIGFDPGRLSVTVHPEDDEAYQIWKDKIGLDEERIIRIEENFWDIGEGPSGPNTEIFYDRGEKYGNDPSDPELYPGGENERYLEIWNLVFSQFNHNPDDTYTPLPKKNIDTGMGLERIVCVIQDTETNFETDLFKPIIEATENIANKKYGDSVEADASFKVIADHMRTVTFAVSDGALPSNEGRGYVLRRLLRRAVRFAKQIGIDKPFMYKLVPEVSKIMVDFYPEVKKKEEFIQNVIQTEEERFHETLNEGLQILSTIMKQETEKGSSVFPGTEVFRLYDTYGFPKELTEEYVAEAGFSIDEEGFQEEMEKQRERARSARQKADSMQIQEGVLGEVHVESSFIGYDVLNVETKLLEMIKGKDFSNYAEEGDTVYLFLKETPFYAESGGQVADRGYLKTDTALLEVKNVQKAPNGQHMHEAIVKQGSIEKGATVQAEVDRGGRSFIVKNHTATHLLHQALKDVLGEHVNQAGSLVEPERLRFDFSHFGSVTNEEMEKIEAIVNEKIWQSIPVTIEQSSIEEAKAKGAMALFGEKYGDTVRVVQVGDYSLELCGGCHVLNTAEIGLFKIVSESGIGAGTRRIEAVTAKDAYMYMNGKEALLKQAGEQLKTKPDQVPERIEALHKELKDLQKEKESLSAKISNMEASNIMDDVEEVNGVKILAKQVDVKDMNALRTMVDDLKQKITSGIILLAAPNGDKVQLIAGVSNDLVEEGYHAGKLIKEAATRCGGGGGGRPDMAQAGGKDASKIPEALQYAKEYASQNA
ncbi:alanyl-tRNA synthetase [Halobacillus karajensis]|uniref:Alanine--tRNA ligase n=1 Tax=Halobacillus karajensis TaxID=195088 RepID=A0A024P6C7_9BACI|nr:alanine--tRNA ligase [Halobacillus karajensis]CDQ18089.1 Alanine--tRNA ligase [Halobacillus karajensis]CDQ24440.1 Alanine--tRNA ligase [Halobacillus karajensis]CDQ29312.1 Alanine--tRNA ligase [Halobacillus karajensis]SEH59513.1 alanyl-tRNA synthetase [Halobacillus karajensis]